VLAITVWYPALRTVSMPPAPWFEAPYVDYMAERFGPGMKVLSQLHGHSIPGLPVSDAQTSWPVLLLSHVYRGHREDNRDLAEALASHGYIVVAANHRDAEYTRLEDDTVVSGTGNLWDGSVLSQRMPEARMLLDTLEDWNAFDPLLTGRINLEAMGALGFSVGGETAAELARQDARCRAVAVIGLEPFWDYHLDSAAVSTPILMAVEEPVQDVSSGDIHVNNPAYRLFGMASGPAYYLRIGGTMHHSLTGVMRVVAPQVPGGAVDNRRAAEIMNTCVVSFFNKHLLGQDDHLLDDAQGTIPELAVFMTK
jgi:dienelactone hydrolase